MKDTRGIADFSNITVGIVVVLDYRVGAARQGLCERLIQQLDADHHILIFWLSVFIRNQLDHSQGLVDRISGCPLRLCWFQNTLTRIVEAILRFRGSMQIDINLESGLSGPGDRHVNIRCCTLDIRVIKFLVGPICRIGLVKAPPTCIDNHLQPTGIRTVLNP